MAMTTLGPAPSLKAQCNDQRADVYSLPSGLAAMDDSHRGDVFRCAVTESLTAAEVNAQAQAYAYAGPLLPSGFWTYRIAYRTERLTPASGSAPEGDSAAVVLVPEKPIPGGPLVVVAHGSGGIAPGCAPTLIDLSMKPSSPGDQDITVVLYALAGYGYTVVMPDYAGFSYDQPPGYFVAEDEAHSLLDATRAVANILPSPPVNVAIVGHSQGGHAALAAQSYAKSYGLSGTLVGVAAYAPLWLSLSAFAAVTSPLAGFKTSTDMYAILYSMEYNYSEGLLRGDSGAGLAIFQPAKQQAAKQVITGGACFDVAGLQALGATPADFYDQTWVNDVGTNCAALAPSLGGNCATGAAPTWLARWKLDRPPIDGQGAPVLVWHGGVDTTVKPGFAECGREKIANDLSNGATATASFCYDANADHHSVVRLETEYVNRWIAARAGIGSDPTPCTTFPTGITCTMPPNDL
jgi:pimeloyl-ACP methyl ester carboxylesterase